MRHFIFLCSLVFSVFFAIATADSSIQNLANANIKHHTLIIYSGHDTMPSHVKVKEGVLARLESTPANEQVELYEEYLDGIRLNITEDFDTAFIALWNKKYADLKLDMVVAVGPAADNFLNRHPELFSHALRYDINTSGLNLSDEKLKNNLVKVVDVVLQVLPKTEHLIVVMEKKITNGRLAEHIKAIEPSLSKKIPLEIWNDFSFDELYSRAQQLPEQSAIVYFPVGVDRLGNRQIPFNVIKKLALVSSAPIFVHDDTYLNLGVVGGYLRSLKQEGDMIGRIMLGLDASKTDDEYNSLVRGYFFDDNALKRWHISDKNLPPNSTIINRKESRFYTYRWYIAAVALALLIESILIIVLIRSLRHSKHMELALAEERNLLEVRVAERTYQLTEQTSELEESRILFQDAAYVAKLGVFNYDLITNELSWDDSMFAIYGIDPATCVSVYQSWRKIALSEDVRKIKSALQQAINENTAFDVRFRIYRNAGEIATIHALGQIYRDARGKPLRVVGINQDITDREKAEAIIHNLVYCDPLTQLPNRRLLAERLQQGISSRRRENKQLAVMMMDLDGFKVVNDNLGHAAGDELLQQVAQRISARLRDYDTVARLGGDEFVVLLEDIHNPDDAARVANVLIETLALPFTLSQHDNVQIGTSIGISFFPQHGEDGDELINKADNALYKAKNNGRGCFAYYSEEL
ncbi:MAG: diguanylate cyclase [Methylobacter sp.]|nr:MAG: diguanylate cyclase [Methylobacter sp.]